APPGAHWAAERAILATHAAAPDQQLVPERETHNEEPAVADADQPASIFSAQVHCDTLADIAAGPDDEPGRSAAVLDRLWRRSERGERIDHGVPADARVAGHVHVGDQMAAVTDHNILSDHAIGADGGAAPDLCAAFDARS